MAVFVQKEEKDVEWEEVVGEEDETGVGAKELGV